MKRIMFDDFFKLTDSVLRGRKTHTRRIVTLTLHKSNKKTGELKEVFPDNIFFDGTWLFRYDDKTYLLPRENYPEYEVGEVVAVAQRYMYCIPKNTLIIEKGKEVEWRDDRIDSSNCVGSNSMASKSNTSGASNCVSGCVPCLRILSNFAAF